MADAKKFRLKAGDRRPYLSRKVIQHDDGRLELVDITDTEDAYDITDATITCSMVDMSGTKVIDGAAGEVISGSAGTIRYCWTAADTAVEGIYDFEFCIDKGNGEIFRLPADGYIKVYIEEALT